MQFKVRGITIFEGEQPSKNYSILAYSTVELPEAGMTLSGVQLTWTPDEGISALAPFAHAYPEKTLAVRWPRHGEFAKQLAVRLAEMFQAVGGELPGEAAWKVEQVKAADVCERAIGNASRKAAERDAVDETMARAGLDRILSADAQKAA